MNEPAHDDEDSADLYFGRETIVSKLIERVRTSRSVFITGSSGSGKSSIARWLYATLTPSRNPLEALAAAVTRLTRSPEGGDYLRASRAEPAALHKCGKIDSVRQRLAVRSRRL